MINSNEKNKNHAVPVVNLENGHAAIKLVTEGAQTSIVIDPLWFNLTQLAIDDPRLMNRFYRLVNVLLGLREQFPSQSAQMAYFMLANDIEDAELKALQLTSVTQQKAAISTLD